MGLSLIEYYRHKAVLKKRLAAKSREQMKRRHSFFNMENEIVEEHEQSEDDEEEKEEELVVIDEQQETEPELVVIDEQQETSNDQCSIHSEEAAPDNLGIQVGDGSINEELPDGDQVHDEEDDTQIILVGSEQVEQLEDSPPFSLSFSRSSTSFDSMDDLLDRYRSLDDNLTVPAPTIEPELGFSSDLLALGDREGAASQEVFNEALTLCSGTFDLGSDTATNPTSRGIDFFSNNDLFTVDDDASNNCEAIPEDFDSQDEGDIDESSSNPRSKFKVRDMIDDEASYSGGEKDSDDGDDGRDIGEYEEEFNDEQLPADDLIQEDLARQYIKQKNDEEERRLRILMNRYLPHGDLFTEKNNDRSFRFRMRSDVDVDWSKVIGAENDLGFRADEEEDEEEAQATQVRERKIEMMKWRIEQAKQAAETQSTAGLQEASEFGVSHSLLKFGENIAKRLKGVSS